MLSTHFDHLCVSEETTNLVNHTFIGFYLSMSNTV